MDGLPKMDKNYEKEEDEKLVEFFGKPNVRSKKILKT